MMWRKERKLMQDQVELLKQETLFLQERNKQLTDMIEKITKTIDDVLTFELQERKKRREAERLKEMETKKSLDQLEKTTEEAIADIETTAEIKRESVKTTKKETGITMKKTIEEFIEQIFAENPKMTKDDMRKRLQSEKNPYRPSKHRWRNSTIRQRIDNFYKNKETKIQFSRDSEPLKEPLKIEGVEIKRHPDIFKSREEPTEDINKIIEKGADDGRSASSIQNDYTAFKKELVSIAKDLNQKVTQSLSAMERDITSMKQEIPKIRQELTLPEPKVEYDFLEIKKPFIAEKFTNKFIEQLKQRGGFYSKMTWKQEIIKEISLALNNSYERTSTTNKLRELMQPTLDKHKSHSYFDQYKTYFEMTGMITGQLIGNSKQWTINKDNTIPKKVKELGLLEELGYDKIEVP